MRPMFEAWRRVLGSYAHKLIFLGLAALGFWAMSSLGDYKRAIDAEKKKEWNVSKELRERIAKDCDVSNAQIEALPQPFDSREEMTAALQHAAEANVWSGYRTRVGGHLATMRRLANADTVAATKTYERLADLVAREEAYARADAFGVRQQVQAIVQNQIGKSAAEAKLPNWFKLIADEKSHRYIIFEIVWYASIALGVLSSAYLLMLLFTTIPITSGEGYWTKQFQQLLQKVPSLPAGGSGSRGAIALAALVGGAAAVPPMQAVEPGGLAPPAIVDSRPVDVRVESPVTEIHYLPPTAAYEDAVKRLANANEELKERVKELEDSVTSSRIVLEQRIAHASAITDSVACATDLVSGKVVDVGVAVGDVSDGVDTARAELTSDLGTHHSQSTTRLGEIAGTQNGLRTSLDETTAEDAVRDARSFWGRTFGRTRFQVTTRTSSLILARQRSSKLSHKELCDLAMAVGSMPTDPMTSSAFKRELKAALERHLGDDSGATVENILAAELQVLLQLTAVPRT